MIPGDEKEHTKKTDLFENVSGELVPLYSNSLYRDVACICSHLIEFISCYQEINFKITLEFIFIIFFNLKYIF